ncbi:MAG: hypothetical protein AMJ81_07720 [Phycisphaerae bacterium SM23_33]|jgi:hypothetical protein|nr:MAG: hypothetical protein AMJ81_07720 [Phycisphaerae bacterium SM23_33]
MATTGRKAAAALVAALAGAATCGCTSSSATFPYERDLVWTAAVAETAVWRPTLTDGEDFRIVSEKTDLAGVEVTYQLELERDPNIFARQPSTRVQVSITQTKPSRKRYAQEEQKFLAKLRLCVEAMAARLAR